MQEGRISAWSLERKKGTPLGVHEGDQQQLAWPGAWRSMRCCHIMHTAGSKHCKAARAAAAHLTAGQGMQMQKLGFGARAQKKTKTLKITANLRTSRLGGACPSGVEEPIGQVPAGLGHGPGLGF